jgi:hypothetical protein
MAGPAFLRKGRAIGAFAATGGIYPLFGQNVEKLSVAPVDLTQLT